MILSFALVNIVFTGARSKLQFTFGQREFDCVQFCGDEDQHVVHLKHLDENDCHSIREKSD